MTRDSGAATPPQDLGATASQSPEELRDCIKIIGGGRLALPALDELCHRASERDSLQARLTACTETNGALLAALAKAEAALAACEKERDEWKAAVESAIANGADNVDRLHARVSTLEEALETIASGKYAYTAEHVAANALAALTEEKETP